MLREQGWVIKNQVGSHVQLVHPARPGKVTVPHPKKELPSKTVKSIFKQAGLEEVPEDD
jgi:predicted RNA binding protein YcfA (HicA-like mRNA interferase family)